MRIAVDAMGGDRAPGEIVAGALGGGRPARGRGAARRASRTRSAPSCPAARRPTASRSSACSQVIEMHDEPGVSVRTKKDASVVRAAEAVRDGRADAMVGAGNTGATMASALLRFGRIRGVARPAVAVPIPVPFAPPAPARRRRRDRRLHARVADPVRVHGPDVRPGAPRGRRADGRAALERRGAGQGRRAAQADVRPCSTANPWFVGNVEGRDLMTGRPDVIVTDGFTGNVALKTIEGALKAAAGLVFTVLDSTPEAKEAAEGRRADAAAGRDRLPRSGHGRWCRAARGRRRLRDLPRFVVRACDGERDRPRGRLRAGRGRGSPEAGGRGKGGRRMPAETHSTHDPISADEVFGMVRSHLAEILEIDDAAHHARLEVRRRPRRRLARADRAGRGARGGARGADRRVLGRRRGPRRPRDGARRGRLRRRSGSGGTAA